MSESQSVGKWLLSNVFGVMAFGVVVFCCWFFLHAFDKTMAENHCSDLNLSVNVSSNCCHACISSNTVDFCLYGSEGVEKLREIMTDRERICNYEHDRFRAEMGTWVAIFGLLSVLVTVIVGTCSYMFQQRSLKDEKAEIFAKIEDKVKAGLSSISEQVNHGSESLESTAAASAASVSVVATSVATLSEEEASDGSSNSADKALDKIQGYFTKFVKMWPTYAHTNSEREQTFSKKMNLGIKVLRMLNEHIRNNSGRDLAPWLGLVNGINVYLGQVKKSDFYDRFVEQIREEKPLTETVEIIGEKLQGVKDLNSKIYVGFYRSLYRHQMGL